MAPFISLPIHHLFNECIRESFIPKQWKAAIITPVPKVQKPTSCQEYRLISVTPILSRLFEKLVVQKFLYPVLVNERCRSRYMDQFAFRPTGSTTAALINLVKIISDMLVDYPYVHVITFDVSKAFDSLRHGSLMSKLACLPIPDVVYNLLVEYFDGRCHVTRVGSSISFRIMINCSIVQGSCFGPVNYILNLCDMRPCVVLNDYSKYADDGDLVVPSVNTDTFQIEVDNITKWTESNNLKLNGNKTKELIVYRPGPKANRISPPPTPGIERVSTLNVLGVILDETLTFRQHIEQRVVHSAASSMYALKVLRSRGLSGQQLWDVTTQTLVARMLYASPVWWGFIDAGSRDEIEAVIRRLIRLNYLPSEFGLFEEMCRKADTALFSAVLTDSTHVLNHLLPPVKDVGYNLRPRTHDRCLPGRLSSLQKKNFLNRLLFLDSY